MMTRERNWNERSRRPRAGKNVAPHGLAGDSAGLAEEAIISSDIGNNCAIGNAYPTFEDGRKYLAPGLFGPCGYGFPAIIGAKMGNPNTPGRRFCRRWCLRHFNE